MNGQYQNPPAKHMDLVTMLKNDHGMDHGHAGASNYPLEPQFG